jgi:tetratricopeptide (TPR) repeat protein
MDIRKLFLTPHAITAFVLTVALTFPCVVEAVSIGEVALQSKLGEPLLAQVDMVLGSGEHIKDSCLSLVAPDPLKEDISGFLTEVNLSLKTEGQRQYVVITSRKPFNDAFAKLRLQVKCPGTRSVTKTLTIPTSAQTASKKQDSSVPVRPQVDESHTGEVGSEGCASLLAQQKLLDPNDQRAGFLAMQCLVNLLQDEVGELKLQRSLLIAGPFPPASLATAQSVMSHASPTVGAATGTQENRPKPDIAVKQPVVQQDNFDLPDGLLAALGLVLVILAVWLGLRYYTKIKSRSGIKSLEDEEYILKPAGHVAAAPKMAISPVVKPPSKAPSPQAPAAQAKSVPTPAVVASPKTSAARSEAASAPLPAHKFEEEVSEEDSMLEEAGLYASHGRPTKAVEILQDIIQRRPEKANAWPLLLSIYSSLGKAEEFENTAREFLKHHPNSPAWSGMQALGRTFDMNNPLYADSHVPAPSLLPGEASPRRPIGDILMEMGILSKQDLQSYLDDFEPKKHGRFGGYLVVRKAITLAQLDQALLQQQGVDVEVKPSVMPSLQDMENLLADFDSKRDGSIGEFLASRNASTPEQLSQLLQQQSSQGAPVKTSQANNSASFEKVFT